ncbi:MAG: putative DNA binding domain-containing protein [Candidatus Sumerlaeota bacterium]|nr:putative DNA binding domain-containing protein [Candidatus Sumerlaeota bacterium]
MTSHFTDQELRQLIHDLESDRVERKSSFSDSNKIREAICAFANDMPNHQKPGIVFIGVHDDGSCAGLPITDELLLNLSHIRSDGNILPFPVMSVEKRCIDGCEMAVVIVQPSLFPPVRFNGRVWIRVGPRRATATMEEELRLSEKRRGKDLPFDIRPNDSAALSDLDLDLFSRTYLPCAVNPDVLLQNQRSAEQQLVSLRFTTTAEPPAPTNLGLIVCGKIPTVFVPGAYIQFLRVEGTEVGDPIKDQKEISNPLPESLRILDEILSANISVATSFLSTPQEIKSPDYPLAALQQIARNAVLHRTYEGTYAPVRITWFSDRIEIENPGGPFGRVHRDNFGKPGAVDYRNPNLAEAMKNLGYVQRFGWGIHTARKEMAKNGNPEIEFVVEENAVLAILRRKP